MSYMQDHLEDDVDDFEDEPTRLQCRHIKPDGIRCGSPSLRNESFCYYHHTARRPGPRQPQVLTAADRKCSTFNLPSPADLNERPGVQLAIALILHKIANNEIDPRRAGLLLYGLQIASGNLKQERPDKKYVQPEPVEEITEDPTHGPLAPEGEVTEPITPSQKILRRLMRRMEAIDEGGPEDKHGSVPHIQAKAAPTPNRACRRKLLRCARKFAKSKKPGRSRALSPHLSIKG